MRFLVAAGTLSLALLGSAAHADPTTAPAALAASTRPAALAVATAPVTEQLAAVRLGAVLHWAPERLGRHVGLGIGWTVPQRWYDVDGQLLTERSLLTPGEDLERSGFYFALRF